MAKGQSALRCMMTYGWAILIIVIVAVILYSMGIFNPRASVTASSSGFSPFAASAAVCGASNLTVAFTVGGLPSGATSASLMEMFLNSGTGMNTTSASSTVFSPSTIVSSGNSFTVTFKDVKCSTSGVGFTASGILEYSITAAGIKAPYNATGTVAGTSS